MADTFFEGASDALSNMDPEQMAAHARRLRRPEPDARAARARRGARPELRAVHGAVRRHVPGQPADPRRAARSSWPSAWRRPRRCGTRSPPSSRRSCASSMEAVLEDMDLRWQVERLAQNLQRAVPDAGWQRSYDFDGEGPMSLYRATDLAIAAGPARPHGGRAPVAPRPRPRWARSTSTRCAATWARTPPARSTGWPS